VLSVEVEFANFEENLMTLIYLVAAWTAGILLASSISTRPSTTLIVGMGITLSLASSLMAYAKRRDNRWRLFFVCTTFFTLGIVRFSLATRPLPKDHVAHWVDTGFYTLTGMVDQDIDVRDNHINLRVEVTTIRQDDDSQPIQGIVLVQAPRYGDYAYGDRVRVSGSLLTPPEFDDFSYRDYLARRGIHAIIPNARVEIIEHDQGKPWLETVYSLRAHAQKTIDQLLPSPQAPLLSGILLGIESGISIDIREAFNDTGTAHVIAISGANIVIVIRVLMGLLGPIGGRRLASLITLSGVGLYAVFVGADPAVLRAAMMGGLSLLAAQLGRRTYGFTSLAFSMGLMTLWNPLTLWDISFQLSAAATAGLLLFGDDFARWLKQILELGFSSSTAQQISNWLAEPLVVSLAAQIATAPLVMAYFGRLSLVSLLANILIVPAQTYIMILGWIAVVLGIVWSPLGQLAAWIVWLPLTYTIEIVRAFDEFDWASIQVDFASSYAWSIYLTLLFLTIIRLQHPDDRKTLLRIVLHHSVSLALIVAGVLISILIWTTALTQPDGKLHLWFLDIGQGHAVLIQTPQGAQILVDGGPNPAQLRRTIGDALPFWDDTLDVLFVTQPKQSAIGGLPALLDRYRAQAVFTNGHTATSDSYRALIEHLERNNSQVLPITAGYRLLTGDGVEIEVLHPQEIPSPETKPEEAGMILRISYGDAAFLLNPDLTEEAETTILDAGWYIGCHVLELSTHGSAKTNSESFIAAASPQIAVVSVEAGNRSGLPAPEIISRVENSTEHPLFRTDRHGTIEMVTDGHDLWIYTER
jgi:competence protein ComEC